MVSFIGYKQFGGKEKKMQETEKEDEDDETIRLKKSSIMFAAQVLSFILLVLSLLIIYCFLFFSGFTDSAEMRRKTSVTRKKPSSVNDHPIIGILTQELDPVLTAKLPPGHTFSSYLAASYVQWVQAGGARAVPVIIGKDDQYYKELFSSLNGLLLPGGSAPLTGAGGYAEVGGLFYDLAKEANDAGDSFPIWGTCNGFELLTVLSSKDHSRLTDCDSQDDAVPLNLLPEWEESSLFSSAPPDVLREITEEKITINFHNHCMTPENFTKYGMDKFWNPLSYNYDGYNLEYLSSIESKNYPFFGVQFHPEKNIFEWAEKEPRIPHSRHAVHVSLYFATYFVNQARKSSHRFKDRTTEEQFLSYRYKPHFVGSQGVGWTFEQAYLF